MAKPPAETPSAILFIHASNELYGSDVVLLELIRRLDRSKYEPIVILPADLTYQGALSSALTNIGVKCRSIKMGVLRRRYFKPRNFPYFLRLVIEGNRNLDSIITDNNIRLIHSNTSAVLGGAFMARKHRIPHVWHVHEILEKPNWMGWLIYRMINQTSDRIVAISRAVEEHMRLRLNNPKASTKIDVVWDGVDCEKFSDANDGRAQRAAWNIDPNHVLVGMVGRISHWKGQELFIHAASQAYQANPNLRFVIVGSPVPGEESRITELVNLSAKLDLGDAMRFVPFSSAMPEIYRALDLLVLPSILPEPLGLVVLEAMASGKPVIASAHGGPLETIVSGVTGLHFEPGNATELSQCILALSQNAELRQNMGRAGRKRAVDSFSLDVFSKKFDAIYSDLLERE